MIELEVEEYCQNCSDFEADVSRIAGIIYCDTFIRCEHRGKCGQLYDYIKRNEVNKK